MHDRMACQDMLLNFPPVALHMSYVVVKLMVFHPVVSHMLDVGWHRCKETVIGSSIKKQQKASYSF